MHSILKINGRASLVMLGYGQVFLKFGNRHFARNELVPYQLLDVGIWTRSSVATMTAGDFVEACMQDKFKDVAHWPLLARDFVFPTYTHIFKQDVKSWPERR